MSGPLPSTIDASQLNAADASARARMETEQKLALYGSIDRWPSLSLLPNQFPICECGHRRDKHPMVGTERGSCRASKKCTCACFVAVTRANGVRKRKAA